MQETHLLIVVQKYLHDYVSLSNISDMVERKGLDGSLCASNVGPLGAENSPTVCKLLVDMQRILRKVLNICGVC